MDDFTRTQKRTVRDYRLAFGLTITHTRELARLTVADVAASTRIPEQTLRSYERGDSQPQVRRLLTLAEALNVSSFNLLVDTSKYIYRSCGRPHHQPESACRTKLCATLLYCGATPDDIDTMLNNEDF